MPRVTAVVGGQYGSEGKGKIVAYIANEYGVHVRSGGANAGHSIYHNGQLFKMRQIPCGWINPQAKLIVARGALVDIDLLLEEIEMVSAVDKNIHERVLVDAKAHTISDTHRDMEGGIAGDLHRRIGSTGEGVGAARIARVRRDPTSSTNVAAAAALYDNEILNSVITDSTPHVLFNSIRAGVPVLLEGTQGYGLSLIHGPWPYVTSHDTNAATLAADAGISPIYVDDVILVIRTYPIRVAGNSGPMYKETSWQALSAALGREVIERTTVTNKVRRVGQWDEELVEEAVVANAPTQLALMFADYLNTKDYGVTDFDKLSTDTRSFIEYLERMFNIPVTMIGTGPKSEHIIDRRNGSFYPTGGM